MKIKSQDCPIFLVPISILICLLLVLIVARLSFSNVFNKKQKREQVFNKSSLFHDTETIEIIINRKRYNKLLRKRNSALNDGILLSSNDDLVKASIFYKGKKHKSQIRLKGDWTDHLVDEKWSFRVSLEGESTIEGMRKFSLQHPKTRNYAGEWLFHRLLKKEGIINLRYFFLPAILIIKDNIGEERIDLGYYAVEEFFEKRLIEHNQRREGVIIKIDEDPLWRERQRFLSNNMSIDDLNRVQLSDYQNLNILPYGEGRIKQDSGLMRQFLTAKTLLSKYIKGDLQIHQVFDVEKLAKYNAICNILGADHALIGHNYRFYYNPINSRLEPIGFDANAGVKSYWFNLYEHAESDSIYMQTYLNELERVSTKAYFDDMLNLVSLDDEISKLETAYPDYKWNENILNHNRYLAGFYLFPDKSLNVFLEKSTPETITLSVANYGRFPAQILDLRTTDERIIGYPTVHTILSSKERTQITFDLNKGYQRLFVNKKKKKARFDIQKDLSKIVVGYKTVGTSKILSNSILYWPSENQSISETDIFRQEPTHENFEFLVTDETTKTIRWKKGNWVLSERLIIPPDYTLIITGGTTIGLKTYLGSIVSFSPIHCLGTMDEVIQFHSIDKASHGILVLNHTDTSIVRHCRFDNLANLNTEGWAVSGAVNFYDAPVKMQNCIISNNRCEDALNIINTTFELDNIIFENTQADAFDGDYVNGVLKNCLFSHVGNDAIDVSGSIIEVNNVSIVGAGDKGLSAGENSRMTSTNIVIKNCEIAVASKDQSLLTIKGARLVNNKLGFTAFQKKPEFGKAEIIAIDTELVNQQDQKLIETGSILKLNGQIMETTDRVVERMYGEEYGKKSQ